MENPYSVLWWVEAGHRPSVEEAKDRLELLRTHGPTPQAFTFKTAYDPPTADSGQVIHLDDPCAAA